MASGHAAWRLAAINLGVLALYWGVSHLVWLFFGEFGMLPAPIWPAAGVALAAVWVFGARAAPGIYAGAVLANWLSLGAAPATALGIGILNTAGPLAAIYLLRHCLTNHPVHPFGRLTDLFWFLVFGIAVHAALTATGGIASLLLGGSLSWDMASPAWIRWWAAHAAGTALIAPPLLLVGKNKTQELSPPPTLERILVFLGGLVAAAAIFFGVSGEVHSGIALPMLLVIPLAWLAVRCRPLGPALLLPAIVLIALAATAAGYGPYHLAGNTRPLLSVGLMGLGLGVTAFVLTALAEERRRNEARLRLAANVFDYTREGILVTAADSRATVLSVNPAFTAITGYTAEEAVGETPRLLKSEHHDRAFYEDIWHTLQEEGVWQGEIWNRRKDGEVFVAFESISAIYDDAGEPVRYVSVLSDITELREQQAHIHHLAYHDVLTELPNRELLMDRLEQALGRADRYGTAVGVLFLDLDNFKRINDSLGHHVGDELLQEVASRMQEVLRTSDTVGRLGGDEFLVLVEGESRNDGPGATAERILETISRPLELRGHRLEVTPSIGIARYPEDGRDAPTLMKNADAAMYHAKEGGRATYRYFDPTLHARAQKRMQLESELRRAVDNGELELFFQPKVILADGRAGGAEGLIRWHHPDRGLVSPGEFIPVAEESGLILPMGEQILEMACREAASLHAKGGPGGTIAVNLSVHQLTQPQLAGRIADLLDHCQVPHGALEVEITESVLMHDPEGASELMAGLREMGVGLAVDDFGTGYSSLAYLRTLPLDQLKIDRSFVNDLDTGEPAGAIVRAILALGTTLDLDVVAEGIETETQAKLLRGFGCRYGQGFLYARPMPQEKWRQWLTGQGQVG